MRSRAPHRSTPNENLRRTVHSTQTKESHEDYSHLRQNQKPLEVSQPFFNTKHLADVVKKSFLKMYAEYKADQADGRLRREILLATENNEIVTFLIDHLTKDLEWQVKVLEGLAEYVS